MCQVTATAVFRVHASPMSRAEVTGHVIFPKTRLWTTSREHNILLSQASFLQYKFYRQNYSLLVIQRSLNVASQYYIRNWLK